MFYSSLHFAIVNSNYWNIILKPKQVKCLEAIYLGRDTVGVLPTGYGKSIIFHLLQGLFFDKINSQSTSSSSSSHPVVVVVSPLNSLISDQIRRSTEGKIKATALKVRKTTNSANLELDYSETNPTFTRYTPRICFVLQKRIGAVLKFTLPTIRTSSSCRRSPLYS